MRYSKAGTNSDTRNKVSNRGVAKEISSVVGKDIDWPFKSLWNSLKKKVEINLWNQKLRNLHCHDSNSFEEICHTHTLHRYQSSYNLVLMSIGHKYSSFKKETKKETEIKFLQYRCQCRCRDANPEISKCPHLLFQLYAPEICKMFGYKHTETIEYF